MVTQAMQTVYAVNTRRHLGKVVLQNRASGFPFKLRHRTPITEVFMHLGMLETPANRRAYIQVSKRGQVHRLQQYPQRGLRRWNRASVGRGQIMALIDSIDLRWSSGLELIVKVRPNLPASTNTTFRELEIHPHLFEGTDTWTAPATVLTPSCHRRCRAIQQVVR